MLHTDTAFSLGACKPWPGFEFGSPQAFGTPGAGGSMGFADPQLRMGFCYAMNRMGFHLWNDPREVALRHAAQAAARATVTAATMSKLAGEQSALAVRPPKSGVKPVAERFVD